jgi:hypothetical protein
LVNFNGLNAGMFASHGEIFIAKNNLNDEEIYNMSPFYQ